MNWKQVKKKIADLKWYHWAGIGVGSLMLLGGEKTSMIANEALTGARLEAWKAVLGATKAGPYRDAILRVAAEEAISPGLIYAIGNRESNWGAALTPPGPGGTGDFAERSWGKSPMPTDGKGWGRGLMQLDYSIYGDWLDANDWTDPYTIIKKAVQELKKHYAYFTSPAGPAITVRDTGAGLTQQHATRRGVSAGSYPDPRPLAGDLLDRAAVAAYNTGDRNVLYSVAVGVDPDTTSAKGGAGGTSISNPGNYGKTLLAVAATVKDKVDAAAPA